MCQKSDVGKLTQTTSFVALCTKPVDENMGEHWLIRAIRETKVHT